MNFIASSLDILEVLKIRIFVVLSLNNLIFNEVLTHEGDHRDKI